MISLGVLLKNGQERNEKIEAFIEAGQVDANELLSTEAKEL
jgi:hypothetical protein